VEFPDVYLAAQKRLRYIDCYAENTRQYTDTITLTSALVANRAYYWPRSISEPISLQGFQWRNGGTVSGNVDCAIYDLGTLTRLATLGGVAQAGISALQYAALGSPVDLEPGNYLLALVMDNITGRLGLTSMISLETLKLFGVTIQDTAYPLPSTAVPAAAAGVIAPVFMGVGVAS
jgi:hypothetical protein